MTREIGSIETDAPQDCPIKVKDSTRKYKFVLRGELFAEGEGVDATGEVVERMVCDGAWVPTLWGFSSIPDKPCKRCVFLDDKYL